MGNKASTTPPKASKMVFKDNLKLGFGNGNGKVDACLKKFQNCLNPIHLLVTTILAMIAISNYVFKDKCEKIKIFLIEGGSYHDNSKDMSEHSSDSQTGAVNYKTVSKGSSDSQTDHSGTIDARNFDFHDERHHTEHHTDDRDFSTHQGRVYHHLDNSVTNNRMGDSVHEREMFGKSQQSIGYQLGVADNDAEWTNIMIYVGLAFMAVVLVMAILVLCYFVKNGKRPKFGTTQPPKSRNKSKLLPTGTKEELAELGSTAVPVNISPHYVDTSTNVYKGVPKDDLELPPTPRLTRSASVRAPSRVRPNSARFEEFDMDWP